MNRPIKFRAQQSTKDGERGGFVEGFYHETHERPERTESWIVDKYGHQWLVYSDSLGQFTGLLDKNGKEIYEGDIVEYVPTGTTSDGTPWKKVLSPIRRKIVFIGGCFTIEDEPHIAFPRGWEIIGNIYENPELLKS